MATRAAWMRAFAGEMCGSTPEADVVAASAGTSCARQARDVGPLAREVVEHEAPLLHGQRRLVGPAVVEERRVRRVAGRPTGAALEVARGRRVKSWPMSFEPTTLPSTFTGEPSAASGKATWPMPVMASG